MSEVPESPNGTSSASKGEGGLSDQAGPVVADAAPNRAPVVANRPRRKKQSIRRLRAGEALLAGENSLGRALVKAGYAETTAAQPAKNGLTVSSLVNEAVQARAERGERLSDLKPLAIKALAEVISDPSQPGSTRAAAAGSTLKLHAEIGDVGEDPNAINDAEIERARFYMRRGLALAFAMGARFAEKHGLAAALARREEISDRTRDRS